MQLRSRMTGVLAAASLAVLLAGCSSTTNHPKPTAVKTVTAPSSTPSTSPSSSPTPGPSSSPSPSSSAPATPVAAVGACATAQLTGSVTNTSGAAGTTYATLVLTNHGSASCTLQGWPGVSFVGGASGTQIGQPAAFDRSTPHPTVTLAPGGSAHAQLTITGYNASNCDPKTAAGLRVYPPGQRASLFVQDTINGACAAIPALRVGALS